VSENGKTPRVEIINRVPTSICRVIDKQFKVMNAWVSPFLKSELAQK
jgi:hypothetical protein